MQGRSNTVVVQLRIILMNICGTGSERVVELVLMTRLHGMSAEDILKEGTSRKDASMRHFTGELISSRCGGTTETQAHEQSTLVPSTLLLTECCV